MARRWNVNGFSELAAALAWLPWDWVVTVWAYIDESGDHYTKGHRHYGKYKSLTVAGCIAECDQWRQFELEWSRVLLGNNPKPVSRLHMFDLESSHSHSGLYKGWTQPERDAFVGKFLRILSGLNRVYFFGTSTEIQDPEAPLSDAYVRKVANVIAGAIKQGGSKSLMHVVFSENSAVDFNQLGRIDAAVRYAFGVKGNSSFHGDPRLILPLQAADFAAYEIRKFIKVGGDLKNACPYFRKLREGPHSISIPELDARGVIVQPLRPKR